MARMNLAWEMCVDGVFSAVDRYACCVPEKNGVWRVQHLTSAHHRQDEINNFTREDDEKEREERKKNTHKTPKTVNPSLFMTNFKSSDENQCLRFFSKLYRLLRNSTIFFFFFFWFINAKNSHETFELHILIIFFFLFHSRQFFVSFKYFFGFKSSIASNRI